MLTIEVHLTDSHTSHGPLPLTELPADLPASLWDYQLASPLSAIGRKGFPPGFYGRPDKSKWFRTISTNLQPTARQSYVLHGDVCHSIS